MSQRASSDAGSLSTHATAYYAHCFFCHKEAIRSFSCQNCARGMNGYMVCRRCAGRACRFCKHMPDASQVHTDSDVGSCPSWPEESVSSKANLSLQVTDLQLNACPMDRQTLENSAHEFQRVEQEYSELRLAVQSQQPHIFRSSNIFAC